MLLENPKAFMVSQLKKLMDSRTIAVNHPCLFDDTNIRSLFGMLDVSNHGYINYEQYKKGNIQTCVLLMIGCFDFMNWSGATILAIDNDKFSSQFRESCRIRYCRNGVEKWLEMAIHCNAVFSFSRVYNVLVSYSSVV